MKIAQINNVNFKQTFAPSYHKYTDTQKQLADNITQIIEDNESKYQLQTPIAGISRTDFVLTRKGKDDSLTLYNCNRDYTYSTLSESFINKIYIGTYNETNPFNPNDVIKAREKRQKFSLNGILAATAGILGISRIKMIAARFR